MTFFLRARAGHLFIVLMSLYAVGMAIIISTGEPLVAGIVIATMLAVISGWLWTIAAAANAQVAPHLRSSLSKMKTALLAANIGSAALFLIVIPSMVAASDPNFGKELFPPAVPVIFITIAGLAYSVSFAAKRLITFEKQSVVSVTSCIGVAILFWFWYVGVWFLQPRVQRLAAP